MEDSTQQQMLQIEIRAIITAFIKQQKLAARGFVYYRTSDKQMVDENSLRREFRLYIATLKNIHKMPLNIWEDCLDLHLEELSKQSFKEIGNTLKYDPKLKETSSSQLARYLEALTNAPAKPWDVAVLQHFIWQVKRKLNDLPVTYHMMPVVWGTKQGTGKTTAIQKLLQPLSSNVNGPGLVYTGLSFENLGDDRYFRVFAKYPVIFLDEMPRAAKADIDKIKMCITQSHLSARILGTHTYVTHANKATLIGATNNTPDTLIQDKTGGRRFYYIGADPNFKYNWEVLRSLNFLEIWKGVDEGREEPYIIQYAEEIDREQEQHRHIDPLEAFVEEFEVKPSDHTVKDAETVQLADLYKKFKSYCEDELGVEHVITRQSFKEQLKNKFKIKEYKPNKSYRGAQLLACTATGITKPLRFKNLIHEKTAPVQPAAQTIGGKDEQQTH